MQLTANVTLTGLGTGLAIRTLCPIGMIGRLIFIRVVILGDYVFV